MTIHIIDDEPLLLELISEALEVFGYKTLSFQGSSTYLTHMQTSDYIAPHIIITDVQMPGLDGFGLIQKVRNNNIMAKIILMSGFHHHLRTNADIAATLAKPFDFEHLHKVVSELHLVHTTQEKKKTAT